MNNKKIDKEKILSKIDELDGYIEELEKIMPKDFKEYESSIEKKRACERLLQISIETIIDILNIITSGLKLGLPAEEEELIQRIYKKDIISEKLRNILIDMKGFRNILVHKYGEVEDEIVYEILSEKTEDFDKFRGEILKFIDKFK